MVPLYMHVVEGGGDENLYSLPALCHYSTHTTRNIGLFSFREKAIWYFRCHLFCLSGTYSIPLSFQVHCCTGKSAERLATVNTAIFPKKENEQSTIRLQLSHLKQE